MMRSLLLALSLWLGTAVAYAAPFMKKLGDSEGSTVAG